MSRLVALFRRGPMGPVGGAWRVSAVWRLSDGKVSGFEVEIFVVVAVVDEAVEGGVEGVDVVDVGFFGDVLTGECECGVDDESSEVFIDEVDSGSGGCAEGASGFAVGEFVVVEPCEWLHGLVAFVVSEGFGVGVEGFGDGAAEDDLVFLGEVDDAVDVAGSKDFGDAAEDGLFFSSGFDDAASAFDFVVSVV